MKLVFRRKGGQSKQKKQEKTFLQTGEMFGGEKQSVLAEEKHSNVQSKGKMVVRDEAKAAAESSTWPIKEAGHV